VKIQARCALILLALSLASCSGRETAPSTLSFTGNWAFTFTSSKSGKPGDGTGPLTQSGVNIMGTLSLTNSGCSSTAILAGTATGDSLNLVLTENGQAMTLVGQSNFELTLASGTYTSDLGGCLNGDSGTWTASKSVPPAEKPAEERDREVNRD
jgi:hypothetical protein